MYLDFEVSMTTCKIVLQKGGQIKTNDLDS